MHRTLSYLNKKAKSKGHRCFADYVADQIINKEDKGLLNKFVDKWLPTMTNIKNEHSIDPETRADLALLVEEMKQIEIERNKKERFKRLKKEEVIAEYRELGEKL